MAAQPAPFPVTAWTAGLAPSALQVLQEIGARPGILSFALGLPASGLFPTAALAQAAGRVLADDAGALQYGPPVERLRTHIIGLMARRGVECRPEQVFLTTGAQQALALLGQLLVEPGGVVLVEEECYPGFQQALLPVQPYLLTVPTDPATGIDVAAVEARLAADPRPALIYAIADGHNPLGLSMSGPTRQRLVALARQYRVPIVEDDTYGFLTCDGAPQPPLRALDGRWVCYVGSFAKLVAPGLRQGWIVAADELIEPLSILKEAADVDTATFSQHVLTAYLDSGDLPAHIEALRGAYRARRDAMEQALRAHFPPAARWTTPTSGLFFWVELPGLDTTALLWQAVERERVAFLPGRAFALRPGGRADQCLRLSFSTYDAPAIAEGIARLGRVVAQATRAGLRLDDGR